MAEDYQGNTAKFFPSSQDSPISPTTFITQNMTCTTTHFSSSKLDVDLQLSLGGIYNKNPTPTTVPQQSLLQTSFINEENQERGELMTSFLPSDSSVWAAHSVSENPALQRALRVIRLENSSKGAPENVEFDLETIKNSDANQVAGSQMAMVASSSGAKGKSVMTNELVHENPSQGARNYSYEFLQEVAIEKMKQMTRVFTIGGNTNGEETRGFLWKYDENEGAIILCVCHMHFFSAAEFVKHGGGGEVENPMKVIKVVTYDLD